MLKFNHFFIAFSKRSKCLDFSFNFNQLGVNVINLTNRFIAEVKASPMDFVIPRESSTRPYWFYGFDKNFMKLRYQLGSYPF